MAILAIGILVALLLVASYLFTVGLVWVVLWLIQHAALSDVTAAHAANANVWAVAALVWIALVVLKNMLKSDRK